MPASLQAPAEARPAVPRGAVELPALLRRLAGEVRRAADLSRCIETAFDPASFREALAGEALLSAQNMDLLTQHLEALETFLNALALQAPVSCAMDLAGAADGIKLHRLKERICDDEETAEPAPSDLELF